MKIQYDFTKEFESILWYFGIGLSLFVIASILLIYVIVKRKSLWRIIQFGMWVLFSLIWTVTVWNMGTKQYLESRTAFENKTIGKVDGFIENFVPMIDFENGIESFDVNGVHFEYTCRERNYGFNKTKSLGGPIDEGKYVRIQYLEGRILRLWVKK
jgi:hypothetical protein